MKRVEPHLRRPASWPHRNDSKIVSDLPGCCCDQCVIRKATSRKKRIFIACVCDLRTRNKKSTKNIVIMVSWCTIVSRTVHRFIWIVINEWIVPIRCVWDHWMIKLYVCSEIFSLIFLFSLSLLVDAEFNYLNGWFVMWLGFSIENEWIAYGWIFPYQSQKKCSFRNQIFVIQNVLPTSTTGRTIFYLLSGVRCHKEIFHFFLVKTQKTTKSKKKRKKLIEQKLFFSFNAMRH